MSLEKVSHCFFITFLLIEYSGSFPQNKLVSLLPEKTIEPVDKWAWGNLGNGQVYIASRTFGGRDAEGGRPPTTNFEEEELGIGIDLDENMPKKKGLESMSFPDEVGSIVPIGTDFVEGGGKWPTSGGTGGSWPMEPELPENTYEPKGEMISLDDTMQAYKIGEGSKMVIWGHDIFGLTGESSNKGRTKEWADFLADNGYNVLVPDWYRGDNLPGGTFGPMTFTWSKSITNWTRIESDWKNVILPYLEKDSPTSIGLIGTCWGSYPVVRISMFDNIDAGISMHPSHDKLLAAAEEDEKEVLEKIEAPQLFLVEGGVAETFQPGGLSEEILGDKLTLVEFPDMTHGWTVRGNLEDPNVARDVQKAKEEVLNFFEKHLK